MLLLHIDYSEEDAAARIQFAFGQSSNVACLYVFEIHRKKPHLVTYAENTTKKACPFAETRLG